MIKKRKKLFTLALVSVFSLGLLSNVNAAVTKSYYDYNTNLLANVNPLSGEEYRLNTGFHSVVTFWDHSLGYPATIGMGVLVDNNFILTTGEIGNHIKKNLETGKIKAFIDQEDQDKAEQNLWDKWNALTNSNPQNTDRNYLDRHVTYDEFSHRYFHHTIKKVILPENNELISKNDLVSFNNRLDVALVVLEKPVKLIKPLTSKTDINFPAFPQKSDPKLDKKSFDLISLNQLDYNGDGIPHYGKTTLKTTSSEDFEFWSLFQQKVFKEWTKDHEIKDSTALILTKDRNSEVSFNQNIDFGAPIFSSRPFTYAQYPEIYEPTLQGLIIQAWTSTDVFAEHHDSLLVAIRLDNQELTKWINNKITAELKQMKLEVETLPLFQHIQNDELSKLQVTQTWEQHTDRKFDDDSGEEKQIYIAKWKHRVKILDMRDYLIMNKTDFISYLNKTGLKNFKFIDKDGQSSAKLEIKTNHKKIYKQKNDDYKNYFNYVADYPSQYDEKYKSKQYKNYFKYEDNEVQLGDLRAYIRVKLNFDYSDYEEFWYCTASIEIKVEEKYDRFEPRELLKTKMRKKISDEIGLTFSFNLGDKVAFSS